MCEVQIKGIACGGRITMKVYATGIKLRSKLLHGMSLANLLHINHRHIYVSGMRLIRTVSGRWANTHVCSLRVRGGVCTDHSGSKQRLGKSNLPTHGPFTENRIAQNGGQDVKEQHDGRRIAQDFKGWQVALRRPHGFWRQVAPAVAGSSL